MYEVVKPLGKSGAKEIKPAQPLDDLADKTIGFFWTIFTNGDKLADVLEAELRKQYKDIRVVKLPAGKDVKWGDYPEENIGEVAQDAVIDAAVVLVGG